MSKSIPPSPRGLIVPLWLMLVIGALCLVLPGLVWFYQLSSPSDGARLTKQPGASNPIGITVDVFSVESELRGGDVVVAVQGVPMAAWVEGLWRRDSWQSTWERGETIPYTVIRQGNQVEVPVLLGKQPVAAILLENWSVLLFTLVFQMIAVFVLLQKPREPAAQALFLWGMTTSHFYVWSTYLQIYDFVNGYGFWLYMIVASILWLSTWPAGLQLTLTFPTPLPILQRRPRLVWLLYPLSYAIYIIFLVISRLLNPSPLERIGYLNRGDTLVAILFFIPAIIVIFRQFRLHRSGPERLKIQWVLYSALFSSSMAMALYLVPEFLGLPSLGIDVIGLLLLPFPLAVAIAIWRYQLFDINLIIRRTLVYGLLTAALALVFFSGVAVMQQIFGRISGTGNSPVAIVLSTLAIAALFNPLRGRIQNVIDRRFYRKKYNAEQALARFAARAREETDIEQLSAELVAVVEETMQPETISLWLKAKRSTNVTQN